MIIKAAETIFNSDKIYCSYSDLNFGVTFFGTQCRICLGHEACVLQVEQYCCKLLHWVYLDLCYF